MESETYTGTRTVTGEPMTRLEYNNLRGWELPSDENGNDEGFKVTDVDTKHVSWLPALDFIHLYKPNF